MSTHETTVAVINGQAIKILENGQMLVPIKPICEALGIDAKAQRDKISSDQILGSVGVLSTSTGSDGKHYEMFCIPFKYVFGWLFTINPSNVKEEARENLIRYKEACYDALYRTFAEQRNFLKQKQDRAELLKEKLTEAKKNFKHAKSIMDALDKQLDQTLALDFETWRNSGETLPMFDSEGNAWAAE